MGKIVFGGSIQRYVHTSYLENIWTKPVISKPGVSEIKKKYIWSGYLLNFYYWGSCPCSHGICPYIAVHNRLLSVHTPYHIPFPQYTNPRHAVTRLYRDNETRHIWTLVTWPILAAKITQDLDNEPRSTVFYIIAQKLYDTY